MAASTTFIAVYRGATIGEAHLIAVTTDPDIVREVVTQLLDKPDVKHADPAIRALESGRRAALKASAKSHMAPDGQTAKEETTRQVDQDGGRSPRIQAPGHESLGTEDGLQGRAQPESGAGR